MKRLLFPFVPLYDRLNLKQRWWHRLAVVMFFLAFIVAASLIGVITWLQLPSSLSESKRRQVLTSSFPQLESPEDSSVGVDFDFVETVTPKIPMNATPNEQVGFDWSKYPVREALDCYDPQGQLLVDEGAAFNGVITKCAPGETSKPKSERIHVPLSRLRYVEQAESCQEQATAQYAKADTAVYRSKMDECLDPKRYAKESPATQESSEVLLLKKVALKREMETNHKGWVEVPKVGVVAFPGDMEKSEITHRCQLLYDRSAAAERRAKIITISYALAVLIALFYVLQIVYRAFLYVVFGGDR
jgi:hypothetical protein